MLNEPSQFDPLDSSSDDYYKDIAIAVQGIYQALRPVFDATNASTATSSRLQISTRRQYIVRDYKSGPERLYDDYFTPKPVYPAALFHRRFRMSRNLFNHIIEGVEAVEPYFNMGKDAAGKTSLTLHQKCTAAIRQLAYGCSPDLFDEYLRIGELKEH